MTLSDAERIADGLIESMRPYCLRVEIAGSIRRRKPEVKDIELVCVPKWEEKADPTDLFGETVERRNLLYWQWDWARQGVEWIKPGTDGIVPWHNTEDGKYWRGYLRQHRVKLDLFMATPDNFGAIKMIRSGSADYSKAVMTFALRIGCKFDKGQFVKHGEPLSVPEEADVFDALGLQMPDPENRTGPEAVRAKRR